MEAFHPGGYVLGQLGLNNAGVTITLSDTASNIIDIVDTSLFSKQNGKSLTLDPDAFDAVSNDDATNWGVATAAYGLGDFGTPGAENPQLSFIHQPDLL